MTGDEGADDAPGMVGGRHLPIAILVGVILAGLFLVSLFWRAEAFAAVVTGFAVIALVEAARVVRPVGIRLLTPVLVASAIVAGVGAFTAGPSGPLAGVAILVGGSALALLADRSRREVVRTISATSFFGLWVAILASYAVLLVDRDDGPVVVLAVVGAAIVADIGGYAFGVPFGRHKVAPSVSPNKSWEGLIGGLLVAGALAAAVLPLVGDTFEPLPAAVLAVLCGLAAFLGDLFESMVKRDLGVKDLGGVLPGHGGVLDRVDGILFALPVGYYAVALVA